MAPVSKAAIASSTRLIVVVLLIFWPSGMPGAAYAEPVPGLGFMLPVAPPPVVLTPFRAPATTYGPGHRGADLAADAGSPVLAAGPGRVVFAGTLAGRGVVSIEHQGGLRTTYEPVTSKVREGGAVRTGEVIGILQSGHPGCAPATCLHWGARLPDRLYLDPMTLLKAWPVRLLPWEGR